MKKGIRLTREQVLFLVFSGILGNIVYTHTWINDATDRSAWLASLTGILLVIPFALWILYLGKLYPQTTVFDMIETGLGKIPCKVLCIIFIFINIAVSVAQLNMFTQMLRALFLLYTPSGVIMLFLVLISVLFVNSEIVIMGRLFQFLGVLGLINYFSSFIFAFPKSVHLKYIIPIFDTSVAGFIKGTLFMTGASSECLLLLMVIVRFIPDPFKHYKWVAGGIAVSGVVFSSAILMIIAIVSPELTKRIAFGGVHASSMIHIGEFIRGLEVFVFGTYQFIALTKTALCLYCAWMSSKKIFSGKKAGIQLLGIAFLILIPSVWLNSYLKAYFLAVFLGSYVILPFSVLILLLAAVGIKIRNRRTGSASP